jgi:hypothetical protein
MGRRTGIRGKGTPWSSGGKGRGSVYRANPLSNAPVHAPTSTQYPVPSTFPSPNAATAAEPEPRPGLGRRSLGSRKSGTGCIRALTSLRGGCSVSPSLPAGEGRRAGSGPAKVRAAGTGCAACSGRLAGRVPRCAWKRAPVGPGPEVAAASGSPPPQPGLPLLRLPSSACARAGGSRPASCLQRRRPEGLALTCRIEHKRLGRRGRGRSSIFSEPKVLLLTWRNRERFPAC